MIGRRTFLAALYGGAACWASRVSAQDGSMPVIGFLDSGSPVNMEPPLAAFHRGLAESGYSGEQNIGMEYRWAYGHPEQLPNLAADLVRRGVAVIVASRGPGPTRAAKAATSTIPIVFETGTDPVKDGLVASLNRPGANVTGATRLSTDLIAKRLALMLEILPGMKAIALLANPASPQFARQVEETQAATRTLGLAPIILKAGSASDLDAGFSAFAQSGAGGMVIATDPLFIDLRAHIISLALRHSVPTCHAARESVVAGGLISYAASYPDSYRQVGVLVGRVLKGAKPEDLPVQEPDKLELVINLSTARKLGLTIPPSLLARADEVIE